MPKLGFLLSLNAAAISEKLNPINTLPMARNSLIYGQYRCLQIKISNRLALNKTNPISEKTNNYQ